MSNQVYDIALKKNADGAVNFGTADLRVLLLKSGYTFGAGHQFVSDLTPGSNELTVSPYSRKTLASLATALDGTNHRATMDAADVDFGALATGETIASAVIFVHVTNDSDSWLVGYIDTGGFPLATNGEVVKIQWDATGWGRIVGS